MFYNPFETAVFLDKQADCETNSVRC